MDQKLIGAVRELERLLGHLRSCKPCYTNEPCLDRHFLIKDVQTKTEEARRIARRPVVQNHKDLCDVLYNTAADCSCGD